MADTFWTRLWRVSLESRVRARTSRRGATTSIGTSCALSPGTRPAMASRRRYVPGGPSAGPESDDPHYPGARCIIAVDESAAACSSSRREPQPSTSRFDRRRPPPSRCRSGTIRWTWCCRGTAGAFSRADAGAGRDAARAAARRCVLRGCRAQKALVVSRPRSRTHEGLRVHGRRRIRVRLRVPPSMNSGYARWGAKRCTAAGAGCIRGACRITGAGGVCWPARRSSSMAPLSPRGGAGPTVL